MNNQKNLKPKNNQGELKYWLALWRAPSVGPITFNLLRAKLQRQGATLKELFFAKQSRWEAWKLSPALQQYLYRPDWEGVALDLTWIRQPQCFIVRADDPYYPPLLAETAAAPPLLFVKGDRRLLTSPQIALVGSRNATLPGREFTQNLAADLAKANLSVTSGLARGIDGAAHRGALKISGHTLAVLGTGADCIYPCSHRGLADEICEKGGLLVSELPIGVPPRRIHFPRRNRIISGLSLGVVVVEASLRSGSLITARYGVNQGREIFAVPGAAGHPLARGSHHLIREGAKLTETVEDILEELPNYDKTGEKAALIADLRQQSPIKSDKKRYFAKNLDKNQVKLLQCVGFQPTLMEAIVSRSQLSAAEVAVGLLDLELKGYICAIAGNTYLRRK